MVKFEAEKLTRGQIYTLPPNHPLLEKNVDSDYVDITSKWKYSKKYKKKSYPKKVFVKLKKNKKNDSRGKFS